MNKRTSRMSANIPVVRHNLVPLSFNDISKDDYASAVILRTQRYRPSGRPIRLVLYP